MKSPAPSEDEVLGFLGSAAPLWQAILAAVEGLCSPLDRVWKESKTEFGRLCLLQYKKKTLLYLTPDQGQVWLAIVLGPRAYQLALASQLPEKIKQMLASAKPYAEGRGIRFSVGSAKELPTITMLVNLKTTPRN